MHVFDGFHLVLFHSIFVDLFRIDLCASSLRLSFCSRFVEKGQAGRLETRLSLSFLFLKDPVSTFGSNRVVYIQDNLRPLFQPSDPTV
jgi:hypothetical protein